MLILKFLIPEIFLSISIFFLLMLGVFLKNSFSLVYRLSIFVIFAIFLLILTVGFIYEWKKGALDWE